VLRLPLPASGEGIKGWGSVNVGIISDGKLVLIDFGASKQLSQTVMTQQGTMIGSFGYAPQEQMQDGKAYPTNDLYSLGVTCVHLLTGIRPSELWQQQGYGWVTGWREYLKQPVSQEFAAILDKLLQPDYLQRYQSAEEVLQAFTNLNQKNKQKIRINKNKQKTRINPKLIGISVTLLLAVVIGVVFLTRSLDIRLPKNEAQKKEIPAF
jgi:serine/threonine protein kinase